MTIIKVARDGKTIVKKKPDETAVPLTPSEDNARTGERTLHIHMITRQRSKRCVNVLLFLIALLVLSAAIVGSIFLFKYLSHKAKHSKVTVQYVQPELQDGDYLISPQAQVDPPESAYLSMEEEIDIEVEEEIERIQVPRFDECLSSLVIHDFHKNITAIVDNDDRECFLMKLDRTKMSPPRSFADLVRKYTAGYYVPKVDVVRREYTVETPALTDLEFAGPSIGKECQAYDTYRLVKKEYLELPPNDRFEVHFKLMKTYGYTDMRNLFKEMIFK